MSRRYVAMLRRVDTRVPNFAGHYVLTSWGCGASCVMTAAIDAEDGTVVWLPFTVCCWPRERTEPLEFERDSRLLIIHGRRDGKGNDISYYLLDSATHTFRPVERSVRK